MRVDVGAHHVREQPVRREAVADPRADVRGGHVHARHRQRIHAVVDAGERGAQGLRDQRAIRVEVGAVATRHRQADAHHQPLRLVPPRQVEERVLTEDQPPVPGALRLQLTDSVEGVGRPVALDLDAAGLGPLEALDRQLHHRETVGGGADRAAGLAPRVARGDEEHCVEAQRLTRRGGEGQVRGVGRVERAAHNASTRPLRRPDRWVHGPTTPRPARHPRRGCGRRPSR